MKTMQKGQENEIHPFVPRVILSICIAILGLCNSWGKCRKDKLVGQEKLKGEVVKECNKTWTKCGIVFIYFPRSDSKMIQRCTNWREELKYLERLVDTVWRLNNPLLLFVFLQNQYKLSIFICIIKFRTISIHQ